MKNKVTRILYVCRLFNGFQTSLDSGVWAPTGVPTIYKLINFFDSSSEYKLQLLIVRKESGTNEFSGKLLTRIKLVGLKSDLRVVGRIRFFGVRIRKVFQEIIHLFLILYRIAAFRPDVVYMDHGNLISAALVARYSSIPVIFRLMGVYPAMRNVLSGKGRLNGFLRWCYRSPFSMIVCTQDGSGIERWLGPAVNPDITVHRLINGADYCKPCSSQLQSIRSIYNIPDDKIKILTVGKLEKIKGIFEFLDGFRLACEKFNHRLHAIIIGYGDQYEVVNDYILRNDIAEFVTLISRLPHKDIYCFHEFADIYVSANRLANLTNANLEAMASGQCMIIPRSQDETGVDLITDTLLSDESVYRVDFPPTGQNICEALCDLISHPDKRFNLSRNIKLESAKFLQSWSTRVDTEIELIQSILMRSEQ